MEISARRIDLDGFLLDELTPQFRLPEVAGGFVPVEEKRVIEFASQQRCGRWCGFEEGTAATTLGKQDLGDIEERINTRDLVDFLADEVHGFRIGNERDSHAG